MSKLRFLVIGQTGLLCSEFLEVMLSPTFVYLSFGRWRVSTCFVFQFREMGIISLIKKTRVSNSISLSQISIYLFCRIIWNLRQVGKFSSSFLCFFGQQRFGISHHWSLLNDTSKRDEIIFVPLQTPAYQLWEKFSNDSPTFWCSNSFETGWQRCQQRFFFSRVKCLKDPENRKKRITGKVYLRWLGFQFQQKLLMEVNVGSLRNLPSLISSNLEEGFVKIYLLLLNFEFHRKLLIEANVGNVRNLPTLTFSNLAKRSLAGNQKE